MGGANHKARVTLCLLALLALVGCGSEDPAKNGPAKSSESVSVLDCTDDADGRTEPRLHEWAEIYYPQVMQEYLEEDEVLRKRFGEGEVISCDDARGFAEIFKEEEDRIWAEWAEANPPDPMDDAIDVSELDDPPLFEPPVMEEEGATDAEDASGTEDAAPDIKKSINGTPGLFWPAVRLVVEGKAECSAVVIAKRYLVTAAHCLDHGNGVYWVELAQQMTLGLDPEILFTGQTYVTFTQHPKYWGDEDWVTDIAVGKTYYSNNKFEKTDHAWLWMDAIKNGDIEFMHGYGATWYLTYGTLNWTAGVVTDYSSKEYKLAGVQARGGDSGAPVGAWHGLYYTLHGIHLGGPDDEAWTTPVRQHAKWIETVLHKTCANVSTGSGKAKDCW